MMSLNKILSHGLNGAESHMFCQCAGLTEVPWQLLHGCSLSPEGMSFSTQAFGKHTPPPLGVALACLAAKGSEVKKSGRCI